MADQSRVYACGNQKCKLHQIQRTVWASAVTPGLYSWPVLTCAECDLEPVRVAEPVSTESA